jgi:hypothetical protein
MISINLKVVGFAAMLALMAAGQAWALITVENSDAPGIEFDAEFPDDHEFDIPAGATVELIKTPGENPAGDTHTLKGPYQGTLDDYVRRECWRPDAACGPMNEHRGGTKGLEPAEGGTRGMVPAE